MSESQSLRWYRHFKSAGKIA